MRDLFLNKKKKLVVICLAVCLVICALITGIVIVYRKQSTYTVASTTITVSEKDYHPTNILQHKTSVKMFVWNDTLYFYPYGNHVKPQYYRELCAIKDKSITSYGEMDMLYVAHDGYVYYEKNIDEDYDPWDLPDNVFLMCLDLSTGETTQLATIPMFPSAKIFIDEDGICYLPKDFNTSEYYPLKDGRIDDVKEALEVYPLGTNKYSIEDHNLVRYSADGTREIVRQFSKLGSVFIIPCDNGLLLYHERACDLLYYLPAESEEVIQLFAFEGFSSDSTVTVHDNWVYVSFDRHKSLEGGRETGFSNDTVEGLYRIDLTDYSSTKLNDTIYDGMYIFDDTGIFACADGRICKLDFDGNEIMTVLE